MAELNQNTVELKLPETESVVVLSKYLTIGQSRELQRMLLRGGKFDMSNGKIDEVSPETFMDMQDKSAEFLIKEIKEKDGTAHAYSADWVYNLPPTDGKTLFDKINMITNASNMTEAERKN